MKRGRLLAHLEVALRRDWVPLEEMVGSALTRLESRLGDRPVTVTISPDVPLLSVDPVLFEQVSINLFENAAKYTPAGSAMEVRAWCEGHATLIEVRDDGPGIPRGDEKRVFDKFHRGPHRGVSGVGLGLPICRGIVEVHGGTIRAEPARGGGDVFRIALPHATGAPDVEEIGRP